MKLPRTLQPHCSSEGEGQFEIGLCDLKWLSIIFGCKFSLRWQKIPQNNTRIIAKKPTSVAHGDNHCKNIAKACEILKTS